MNYGGSASVQVAMIVVGSFTIGGALGRLVADGPGDGSFVSLGLLVLSLGLWWGSRASPEQVKARPRT